MRMTAQPVLHDSLAFKFLACEAGVSIKPGAQAPGSNRIQGHEPAIAGESLKNVDAAARFTGSTAPLIVDLGLTPQALCLRLLRRLCRTFRAKPAQTHTLTVHHYPNA
jgi:hypothetical protein